MNYIENKKYLKSNDLHFYVGWIILTVGIVLFAMGELFWIYIIPYQWIISIAALIIGAITAFVPRIGRGNEESLDEGVNAHCTALGEKTVNSLGKRLMNQGEAPAIVGQYLLEGNELLFRKGRKDERLRSSRYVAAVVAFAKDGLYLLKSNFSLISNEESQAVSEIPYASHPIAYVEEKTVDAGGKRTKIKELVLHNDQGEVLRIATENSVFVDELCEKINRTSQKMTKL